MILNWLTPGKNKLAPIILKSTRNKQMMSPGYSSLLFPFNIIHILKLIYTHPNCEKSAVRVVEEQNTIDGKSDRLVLSSIVFAI